MPVRMKLRAKILSPAQPQVQTPATSQSESEPVKAVIKEEAVKLEPVVAVEPPSIEKAVEDAVTSEPVIKEEPVTEVRPKQAVQRCRSIWHSDKHSLNPQPAPKRRNPIIGIRI